MAKDPKDKVRGELDRELTRLSRKANEEGLLNDKVIEERLRNILFALRDNRLEQAKTLVEGFDTVLDNRKSAKEKKEREEQQKKKRKK